MHISHVTHIYVHSWIPIIPFPLDIILILEYYDLCNAPSCLAIFLKPIAPHIDANYLPYVQLKRKLSAHSWMQMILQVRSSSWWLHILQIAFHLDHGGKDVLICLLIWLITGHVVMQVQYMLSPQVVGPRHFDPGQTMSRDKLRTTCRRCARRCLNSCFRVASVRWHDHTRISIDAPQRW